MISAAADSRSAVSMPMFRQYFDVFGRRTNRELLRLALGKHKRFSSSKTSPGKHYPDWRKSTVIYEDELRLVGTQLKRELLSRLPDVLESLRIPRFDIGGFELQLTSHNDGEYFRWHTDNGSPQTAARMVSFVYYFHHQPKRYRGGELVLHAREGRTEVVEPANDSLVMFGSHCRHEVLPVVCPTGKFKHGRFTLNGWIRRREWSQRADDFGYRIFAPYRPKRSAPVVAAKLPAAQREVAALRELNARYASLLGVYGKLHALSAGAKAIDMLPRITTRQFVENYYSRNRPFVLKSRLAKSRAVRRWSPEYFSGRFGDEQVAIAAHRNSDPHYERHFRESVRRMTMRELCARIAGDPESNDYYLVARNFLFSNPGFASLRGELRPPAEIISPDEGDRSTKMWFGPRGTVTPLHHDEHSILFAQVYGRKHFKLVPSWEFPCMHVEDRFYSAVDPETPDRARFPDFPYDAMLDVKLDPGDVLFIPVGWWHWVKSLDVSISVTFSNFRVPGRNTVWTSPATRYG